MVRPRLLILWCLLACLAALLVNLNGCSGTSSSHTTPPPPGKIEHVVIIFQENRTPDNLFQDPVLIVRGADIQNYGVHSQGATLPPTQIGLGPAGTKPQDYDRGHAHSAFVDMCDLNSSTGVCARDGADKITYSCQKS